MQIYFATTEQAEKIDGQTVNAKCSCGQSYAIQKNENILVVVCDACYENSSNFEKYI